MASVLKEIVFLLWKEIQLEWKQKYAIGGLLLYVLSMVLVVHLAFLGSLEPVIWNILFWLVVLFAAVNSIAKSFALESTGNTTYLYHLAGPFAIFTAKALYNIVLLFTISLLALLFFIVLGEVEIPRMGDFIGVLALGCTAFSINLTLISSIAAKSENKTSLLAALSFPLVIPILLSLIKATRLVLLPATTGDLSEYVYFLAGISILLALVSYILFPIVWRS